jgi:hypothetical protein
MISIILIDGTKMIYNTFNEVVNYCKHRIIKLNCYKNNLTELLNKVNKLFSLYTLNNLIQSV